MGLRFFCDKCGHIEDNPVIEYEIVYNDPEDIYAVVGYSCPECKEIIDVKSDCVN